MGFLILDALVSAVREGRFLDGSTHAAELVTLASDLISQQRREDAFPFVDRRCRLIGPNARDFLLRAEASRSERFEVYAKKDLAAAIAIDPTDPLVNFAALTWGPREGRTAAARALLSADGVTPRMFGRALEWLLADDQNIAHALTPGARGLTGWLAWKGPEFLEIRALGGAGAGAKRVFSDPHLILPDPLRFTSRIDMANFSDGAESIVLCVDGRVLDRLKPPHFETPSDSLAPSGSRNAGQDAELNIIVPIYENLEATKTCLNSLFRQKRPRQSRVILVDDRSPNEGLRNWVTDLGRRPDVLLLRNRVNLGFAGSVNAALRNCGSGDVLLLNADTILPEGALVTLVNLARSDRTVGTITPLSNNGEFTSYPAPYVSNPLPSIERIESLNRSAWAANGETLVDLPNGIGFCLYVTRACLDAVGPLSEAYVHGYYEDVEFCLKAGDRGFRNVCATGLYVGHAGSLSFGARKRALVIRNKGILQLRFPGHEADCAAFLASDPLRSARAALDRLTPPPGDVILMLAGPGTARAQAEARAREMSRGGGAPALLGACDAAGSEISLRLQGDGGPRSLGFDVADDDGRAAFREYLGKLEIARIEVYDAPGIGEAVMEAVFELGARVDLMCADFEWFGRLPIPYFGACENAQARGACSRCGATFVPQSAASEEGAQTRNRLSVALSRADAIVPLDRMGEAFARRIFKAKATPLRSPTPHEAARSVAGVGSDRVFGLLVPAPHGSADDLVLKLSRELLRSNPTVTLVVLGACVDELTLMAAGNVFVTGPQDADEHERLIAQYRVSTLALSHRTGFFGDLDRLSSSTAIPRAYFDWSFGAMSPEQDDLALDPRICNEKAARAIANWLASIYSDSAP